MKRPPSKGFTLVELLVVLVILGLLTHLAVREMASIQASQRTQQAQAHMCALRHAIWQAHPGEEPTGFLVDMGRLPRAQQTTNEWGQTLFTASELITRPPTEKPFAVRPAIGSNLVAHCATLADPSVFIPCGWRGNYLPFDVPHARLLDAWGNPLETPDEIGESRLLTRTGKPVHANDEIAFIQHFGADARPDEKLTPAHPEDRDEKISLIPQGGLSASLIVNASFVSETGPARISRARARVYQPSGSSITGALVTVEGLRSLAVFSFPNLTPGICTLVIDQGETNSIRHLSREQIPPGGRSLSLKVFIP